MRLLEDRINKDGIVREGDILKVDSFINHQIDVGFIRELAKEFKRRFADEKITQILTIEASGIGIACIVALEFDVPVVFAKKTKTVNIANDVYTSKVESYTHKRSYDIIVSKDFLKPGDRVLVIDDFLAKGSALHGLLQLINDAGATVVGAGILIEKVYQDGGRIIRDKGIRVESLARVAALRDGKVIFVEDET